MGRITRAFAFDAFARSCGRRPGRDLVLLGRSWEGRAIRAVDVGDPAGTRVLVVG